MLNKNRLQINPFKHFPVYVHYQTLVLLSQYSLTLSCKQEGLDAWKHNSHSERLHGVFKYRKCKLNTGVQHFGHSSIQQVCVQKMPFTWNSCFLRLPYTSNCSVSSGKGEKHSAHSGYKSWNSTHESHWNVRLLSRNG